MLESISLRHRQPALERAGKKAFNSSDYHSDFKNVRAFIKISFKQDDYNRVRKLLPYILIEFCALFKCREVLKTLQLNQASTVSDIKILNRIILSKSMKSVWSLYNPRILCH